MGVYSPAIRALTTAIFPAPAYGRLCRLIDPLDHAGVVAFDDYLGGPSFSRLSQNGSGRYAIPDRDVFRPLQYCAVYVSRDIDWFARDIVHKSGLHLESLIKRVGGLHRETFGEALHHPNVQRKVNRVIRRQLSCFTPVYNAAKHQVDQPMDTHLFSVPDALLTYFISRQLGMSLYPMAGLVTDVAAL